MMVVVVGGGGGMLDGRLLHDKNKRFEWKCLGAAKMTFKHAKQF